MFLYIGHPILGYILPALIFIISFWVAWACYKHFTKKMDQDEARNSGK